MRRHRSINLSRRGTTLLELVATTAILGIVSLAFVYVTRILMTSISATENMSKNVVASQTLFAYLERDLYKANEITESSPSAITIILDYADRPNHDETLDEPFPDGLPNGSDPDLDNDIAIRSAAAPSDKWKLGYNLEDDDDNNNAGVGATVNSADYRIRYYVANGILYRESSTDGSPWGVDTKKITVGITTFTFTYFGNKENEYGKLLDNNNDGIISQDEIDGTVGPIGHGNNNGQLDTPAERQYITSVRVNIELPRKGTSKGLELNTEVSPPLLPLKTIAKLQ